MIRGSSKISVGAELLTYEQRLDADAGWALDEGFRHFEDRSEVQTSLRKIARRLRELGIP